MNDLVTFGYGRVTASAADAEGDTHAFRRGRLAWVGIYRSSTTDIPASKCVSNPTVPADYHLAQRRQLANIRIAVVIDAITGYQATWSDLRDTCPRLVRDIGPTQGRVAGTFLAVGGPAGAHPATQRGVVFLSTANRHAAAVPVGPNGKFSLVAGAGNYELAGRTPQFIVNGSQAPCTALHRVRVQPRRTTHVNIYCERK